MWLASLFLLLETVLWYGFMGYIIHQDNKIQVERANVMAWKRYFKEEVASEWLFYDGTGM